ncbi:Hypothetical protein P9515_14041 [Prochlorococcus marinus str. MIT 9515]|uniref:GP-PDE domain-containing protein n=1 Tax=Prochlorococcus marinus (strain MIT 9515) TaxID=167542 RepID=A2BXV0_PROM5|nr:phosphatidylinositol-specific phospholipase C/glycerophosphodiester phosphodiesterase family protein [Prochlorococcus marinus]ABM72611.1 Hypothetical protein P9515_14041 [Prochlorococcus marinus str. MIT 9515]
MEIIAHRINTINQLKDLNNNFGVEVDIRSNEKNLIIGHDPFSNYINLKDWLSFYNHGTLILNVKENGLEEELIKIMKSFRKENFFILDQSFPYIIKTIENGEKRCAIRLSEYESINTVLSLKDKLNWVWIDFFTKFPVNFEIYKILKEHNFKLCFVSPELQGHQHSKCLDLKNYIQFNQMYFDAVCTKKVKFWEE